MNGSASAYQRLVQLGIGLATLLAIALLSWVGAFWFWRWSAPAAPSFVTQTEREDWASTVAAARFFGSSAPAAPQQTATPQFTLLGTVVERNGGYALIRLPDQTTKLIDTGRELANGVILERVEYDGIVIREQGRTSTVRLRAKATDNTASVGNPDLQTKVTASRCPLPAAELARAYLLHSELLEGVAKAPRSWSSFLVARDGMLYVASEAGIGRLLGLEPQDRLDRSNGIQLASLDDLNRAFIRPLQQNQPVRVTGLRQGRPMEWVYVNAAACVKPR